VSDAGEPSKVACKQNAFAEGREDKLTDIERQGLVNYLEAKQSKNIFI
jgi:hypothetical protein